MSIKDVSVGAWVLLSVIVVSLAAIVIFAPPTMWDALGKADWPHVAGVIGLVGSALVGVFVEWRKATVKAGPLVLLLAASLTLGMASGCVPAAQQAVRAQATVLVSHHSARVAFYEAEDSRCREVSADFAAWNECMTPAVVVQRAADTYRDALLAAEAGIEAYGADGAASMVACAVVAAVHLVDALRAAGAPVPQEVLDVAGLVGEGVCHAG